MATYDEVVKAYKELADEDKEKFKQSLEDRIDESVGEQKALDGEETEQPVKDDIKEAIGEERAIDEKEEAEDEAKEEANNQERHEEIGKMFADFKAEINGKLEEIKADLHGLKNKPAVASDDKQDKLNKLAQIYDNQ